MLNFSFSLSPLTALSWVESPVFQGGRWGRVDGLCQVGLVLT